MEAVRDPMSLFEIFSVFFDDHDDQHWSESSEEDSGGDGDDGPSGASGVVDESTAFWEAQRQLLQEELCRSSSMEKRIRADAEKAVASMRPSCCRCSNRLNEQSNCQKCKLGEFNERLQQIGGHNSAVCTSKWRRSADIPSGEHSYVDVLVDPKDGSKSSQLRVLIELNFRGEFEMARASEEYNDMVSRLPEVFVGREEKMKRLVRIMCAAAKKNMKDQRMHLAPWRKSRYMQSKWLGGYERARAAAAVEELVVMSATSGLSSWQSTHKRSSMLTLDFHRTTLEVH